MEIDRGGDPMSDLTPKQIKDAVLKGLEQIGNRFAKNPRPTDGSVRSALAVAAQARRRPTVSAKARDRGGKSR
jgi:hypothetical protein